MNKCTFCSKELEKGTGKKYIKADGRILFFAQANAKRT